jgi:hypothetical protein|tara:strand:+ start:235 stop:1023 length:789 start_codon:yes stop_codon:yes gene_type:complete
MAFGYRVLGFGSGGGVTPPFSADYVVIAGGGSGWGINQPLAGGAGGAGGFRSSYTGGSGGGASPESALTFNGGTVYTATIGGDKTATTFAGADITDVATVAGGRGGGYYSDNYGFPGGSGGGPSPRGNTAGSGTANEGYPGIATPKPGAGGGAGATASGGTGGAGVETGIDGTPTYLAGGGGQGTGGTGGGGTGGTSGAGTANTGGGGGASPDGDGNDGGRGIVILRFPSASYSGNVTGSPTVTTDGTDTIVKFTATGTYTA